MQMANSNLTTFHDKEKKCTRCGQYLSADLFAVNVHAIDGLASWCKQCHREHWRSKHPPKTYEDAPDLPNEIWKICVEDEHYAVSNLGRVKRIKGYGRWPQTGHILVDVYHGNGYRGVTLGQTRYAVHRLVARAFLGEPLPHQTDVNHLDHDRTNNRLENLEWCSRSENLQWAKKHDRNNRGDRNGHAKLSESDARGIIHLLKTTRLTHTEIGKRFGVSDGAVQLINRGKRWSYLLEEGEQIPLQSNSLALR